MATTRKRITKRRAERAGGQGAPVFGTARPGDEYSDPTGTASGPVIKRRDGVAQEIADRLAAWWNSNTDRILGR